MDFHKKSVSSNIFNIIIIIVKKWNKYLNVYIKNNIISWKKNFLIIIEEFYRLRE